MSNLVEVKQGEFIANYQVLYKLAQTFSSSNLVPAQYHNKPEDCMIALNMAQRSGMEPIFVMQNMYVVKGHPSWSGQACIAMLRNCGLFREVRPVYNSGKTSCYFEATDVKTGQKVTGTTVTLEMAAKEGWGAKWKSMPEQMLAYRAAAFFARVWCPEVLMGCMVEGEADDVEHTKEPIMVEGEADDVEHTKEPIFDPLADPEPPKLKKPGCAEDLSLNENQVEFDAVEL